MEQLVLLLIIGAISLINWLIEQSAKRRELRRIEQERSRQESDPAPMESRDLTHEAGKYSGESRPETRRLLEAFGIPIPEEMFEPVVPAEPVCQPLQTIVSATPGPVVRPPNKLSQEPVKPCSLEMPPRHFLRKAIVWREILGPPRALQSL